MLLQDSLKLFAELSAVPVLILDCYKLVTRRNQRGKGLNQTGNPNVHQAATRDGKTLTDAPRATSFVGTAKLRLNAPVAHKYQASEGNGGAPTETFPPSDLSASLPSEKARYSSEIRLVNGSNKPIATQMLLPRA